VDRVSNVYNNSLLPTDVNFDGRTSAIDALMIINQLSEFGSEPLRPAGSAVDVFLDVNRDGRVSAIDALNVINRMGEERRDGEAVKSQPFALSAFPSAADLDDELLNYLAEDQAKLF